MCIKEEEPAIMQTELKTNQTTEESQHTPPQVTPPPELPAAPPRTAIIIVVLVVVVLALSGAASMFSRIRAGHALAKETEIDSVATVVVVHPTAEKLDEELVLPGSLQAYEESPIYARTSGYLLRWFKDIGSKVSKGELLAQIDTPEVDQELGQTRATRQQIAAQLDLAKISAERWQNLRKTDSVSQQEADTQTSAYQQALANLAAADANVRRLEQMESFKRVYAPFSGVLVKRNVDPGALINAGSGGVELFILAKVDPLRVFTNVPQAYSPAIRVGMPAYVTLAELAGQKFSGTVARTAEAIDPATRTLLTEVDVPNKDGRLLRGSFGEVHFSPKINAQKVTVPVNAMLFRQEGPRLAVVGADNKVQLRPITIGRDYGSTLEVLGGVSLEDRVIINPADSLEDGQKVNVATEAPEGQHS
jgi:multidrug efflux system membrane fusion protein